MMFRSIRTAACATIALVASAACNGVVADDGANDDHDGGIPGDGLGCADRAQPFVAFDPPLTEVGEYHIELDVDGATGTSSAELTGEDTVGIACSSAAFDLNQTLKGREPEPGMDPSAPIEPIPPTDILGVTVREPESPSEVAIGITRDGVVLASGRFAFVDRALKQGECRTMQLTATVNVP